MSRTRIAELLLAAAGVLAIAVTFAPWGTATQYPRGPFGPSRDVSETGWELLRNHGLSFPTDHLGSDAGAPGGLTGWATLLAGGLFLVAAVVVIHAERRGEIMPLGAIVDVGGGVALLLLTGLLLVPYGPGVWIVIIGVGCIAGVAIKVGLTGERAAA